VKKPVKIGIVCECGPAGAEVQVFPKLVRQFAPRLVLDCVPLGNLPKLIQDCGKTTSNLLARGCKRVVIVWDLYPAWREEGIRPCRHEHKEGIFAALRAEDVNLSRVSLVCIRQELEAWLIADGRAVSKVVSTDAHPVQIKDWKKPETLQKPKTELTKVFQHHIHRLYLDRQDAVKIVDALPDLKRLDKIPAFSRFRQKILGEN